MFDLAVLAYRADITRVISYLMARELERAGRYPEIGVPDPHHGISHHRDDPENLAKLAKINIFHMELFAYFLEKLQATPDGDGTLLDHVDARSTAAASATATRTCTTTCPSCVAGGGAGTLKGGRHLMYPRGTPMANLCLTLLDKMDVRGVEKLATATDGSTRAACRCLGEVCWRSPWRFLRRVTAWRSLRRSVRGRPRAPPATSVR